MSTQKPIIRHISETALWTALHRAGKASGLMRSSETRSAPACRRAGRTDRRLFCQRASAIEWTWITRTYLFDHYIRESLKAGADMVVNLAAGLDTRPYRMELPPSLRWVEVDLPDLLDYKESILEGERPGCRLDRIRLDISDRAAGTPS